MRERSDRTIMRELRKALHGANVDLSAIRTEVSAWRGRATKAEQEATDWRKRFDALLARVQPTIEKAEP